MRRLLVALSIISMLAGPAMARQVKKIPLGSRLRVDVLNAIRPVFEKETAGPIEFVVKRLTIYEPWAYGKVIMQRPGGDPINWKKTDYAEDLAAGMFDPGESFFLLRRVGRGWDVIHYAAGPTDVIWDGWRSEFNLPMAMFTD